MFRGHLRMLVLHILGEQPASGYGIMKQLQEKTGRKPSPGALYPVLEAMSSEGLLTKKQGLYSLTKKGSEMKEKMGDLRTKMIASLEESTRMWGMMCPDEANFHDLIIDALKRGEVPFKEISTELSQFRGAIVTLYQNGSIRKNQKSIITILKETTARLQKIK